MVVGSTQFFQQVINYPGISEAWGKQRKAYGFREGNCQGRAKGIFYEPLPTRGFLKCSWPLTFQKVSHIILTASKLGLMRSQCWKSSDKYKRPTQLVLYLFFSFGLEPAAGVNKRKTGWSFFTTLITVKRDRGTIKSNLQRLKFLL